MESSFLLVLVPLGLESIHGSLVLCELRVPVASKLGKGSNVIGMISLLVSQDYQLDDLLFVCASIFRVSLETSRALFLNAKVGLSLVFEQGSGDILLKAVFFGSTVPRVFDFFLGKGSFGSDKRGNLRKSNVALSLSERRSLGDCWFGKLQVRH